MKNKTWLLIFGLLLLPACHKQSSDSSVVQANKIGYHCPMHPQYHSDKPGSCPICQMQLVPDSESAPVKGDIQSGVSVPGQATVNANETQQQMVGVKVAPVEMRDLYVIV